MPARTWIPQITYLAPASTTLTLTLPQQLWDPQVGHVGGRDESAAGVPEVFVIRRDQQMVVQLRFYEAEWPAVRVFLEWAVGSAQSFTYRFDKDDPTTQYTCYLDAPTIGDRIRPTRDQFPGLLHLELTLRTTNSTPFNVQFSS
jgi:hypothetical protein